MKTKKTTKKPATKKKATAKKPAKKETFTLSYGKIFFPKNNGTTHKYVVKMSVTAPVAPTTHAVLVKLCKAFNRCLSETGLPVNIDNVDIYDPAVSVDLDQEQND